MPGQRSLKKNLTHLLCLERFIITRRGRRLNTFGNYPVALSAFTPKAFLSGRFKQAYFPMFHPVFTSGLKYRRSEMPGCSKFSSDIVCLIHTIQAACYRMRIAKAIFLRRRIRCK